MYIAVLVILCVDFIWITLTCLWMSFAPRALNNHVSESSRLFSLSCIPQTHISFSFWRCISFTKNWQASFSCMSLNYNSHVTANSNYLFFWGGGHIYIYIYIYIYVCVCVHKTGSRDSSVGIAIGYGLDGPGIESRWGRGFPHLSRPALRPTQPPIQWVPRLSRG